MKFYKIPNPTKIIAVGLNYKEHAKELGMEIPDEPCIFLKPPSAVIYNNQPIIYPRQSKRVDYEAELAVVIKKEAYCVPEELVGDYILGYTCANDVTARDLQKKDGQWTRAKSFNTFCPLGPVITDEINPDKLDITLRVNGEVKQKGNTSDMIFNVFYLVSFISYIMTLFAGDVILTGTPPGVGPVIPGDKVEVDINGIGILANEIRKD